MEINLKRFESYNYSNAQLCTDIVDKFIFENRDFINKNGVETFQKKLNEFVEKNKTIINESIEREKSDSINESLWDKIASEIDSEESKFDDQKPIKKAIDKEGAENDIHAFVSRAINIVKKNPDYEGNGNFTVLPYLDVSGISDFTALFAFNDSIKRADLSHWDTRACESMEGAFYKSVLVDDSLMNWDLNQCKTFKNCFVGADFSQKVRDDWYNKYSVNNGIRVPKLGIKSLSKQDRDIDMENNEEELYGKKKRIVKEGRLVSYKEFIDEGFIDDFKNVVTSFITKVRKLTRFGVAKLSTGVSIVIDKLGNVLPVIKPDIEKLKDKKGLYTVDDYLSKFDDGEVMDANIKVGDHEKYNAFGFPKDVKINFAPINESYVNEDRIPMHTNDSTSEATGLDIDELTENGFNELLHDRFEEPDLKSLLIWGCPGIGKSTIPKAIISKWNAEHPNAKDKKSIIIADCQFMNSDSFSLPLPDHTTVGQLLESRPEVKKMAEELGVKDKDLMDKLNSMQLTNAKDAPKTWLPAYLPTGNPKIDAVLDAIANGSTTPKYDADGNATGFEESGNGGIILFDEFLRSEPSVFNIVSEIINSRTPNPGSNYVLGSKWVVIAVSNRPCDDEQISQRFQDMPSKNWDRTESWGFLPSYESWSKYMTDKFGDLFASTNEFIKSEKDPATGEFLNWENIDPDVIASGGINFPTPRTWTKFMEVLKKLMKSKNVKSFKELDKVLSKYDLSLAMKARANVGKECGTKWTKFVLEAESHKSKSKSSTADDDSEETYFNANMKPEKFLSELNNGKIINFDKKEIVAKTDELLSAIYEYVARQVDTIDSDGSLKFEVDEKNELENSFGQKELPYAMLIPITVGLINKLAHTEKSKATIVDNVISEYYAKFFKLYKAHRGKLDKDLKDKAEGIYDEIEA